MRRFSTCIAVVALVGCGGTPPTAQESGATQEAQAEAAGQNGQGVWSQRAQLLDIRSEAANAFANGKLYVMGGLARGLESSTLTQEYDPATDSWQERAPMPAPLSHPNATAMDGKIYVIGGFLAQVHVGAQNAAFEYDPAADSWRTLAPLQVARGSVAVAALDGKIHAIAGRTPDRVTSAVHEVYDPATNSWSNAAPLPMARDHTAVAAVNGRIHVIGGRFDTPVDNTNLHDVYDPGTDSWTPGPPLPTPRSGGGSALYKGLIVVMGGECNDGRPFNETEAFDVETNTWRTLAPMPLGKLRFTATTDGESIYIAGGNPECGLAYSNKLVTFTLP